ncbi:MAG TPA: phytoene desaturase family protein [Prolixibacteraceae bacterium]|nr:phytoene desaturase family protein [Prolixibacteraceae bacterium]
MKKAIIIGSGISGIASALRLVAKGYDVEILEKSYRSGGKISEFTVDGFRFDMGPSLFTLPALVDELFSLFGKSSTDYLNVHQLDVTCQYFFADGSVLKAWSDKQRFVSDVIRFGVDRKDIERYLNRQSFLYQNTSDFFLFSPIHKLSSYFGASALKSLKALHRLDTFTSMHNRNHSTFGDSPLVQLFDRYATYNGSDPYRAPATLNMIAHLEHNTGAFFPTNGMYGIVKALERLALEQGVRFHYNTTVSGLRFNKKKITSVESSVGNFPADVVLSSIDVAYFYRSVLPEKKMLKRIEKRERSSSALIFYWGVSCQSSLDLHNILFSADYMAEFDALFQKKHFGNDLTVYIFISNKVVQSDAPEGCENWFVMVNAPENVGQDWAAETAKARSVILSKISSHLGIDVEKHIVNERIVTPVDIEANTGSVNGSLYGHSSNGALAAFLRHPNYSRHYKNLYFAGGSVHPGGGIPLCLASAKIATQLIK